MSERKFSWKILLENSFPILSIMKSILLRAVKISEELLRIHLKLSLDGRYLFKFFLVRICFWSWRFCYLNFRFFYSQDGCVNVA